MKKIDFSTVEIEFTFGKPEKVDIRKDVGNIINQKTADIGLADLARKIYYSDGAVEISPEYQEAIAAIVGGSNLLACVKAPLLEMLAEKKTVKTSKK